MIQNFITLYNWNNGVFMMGIFVLVCVVLVGALVAMMFGGKTKKDSTNQA